MEDIQPIDILVLALFGLTGIIGSIGNLCIIFSLIVNNNFPRVMHVLIMNLALSDFLQCALSIPLRMLRICVRKSIFKSEVLSSDTYCRVTAGVNVAVIGTSSLGVLLLTVDKFLAVKRPLLHRTRVHKRNMIAQILASWFIPLSMGLCGAFIPALQTNLHDHNHDVACIHSSTFDKAFALSSYCLMLMIPLLLMFPMYIYIIFKVKKSWQSSISAGSDGVIIQGLPALINSRRFIHEQSRRRREMKLTKGIILILGANLICLTPIIVLDFVHIILGQPIAYIVDEICLIILHLNAALDPPIYARHNQEIKRTMIRICCPFRRQFRVKQTDEIWRKNAKRAAMKRNKRMFNLSSSSPTPDGGRIQDSIQIQQGIYPLQSTISNFHENQSKSVTINL